MKQRKGRRNTPPAGDPGPKVETTPLRKRQTLLLIAGAVGLAAVVAVVMAWRREPAASTQGYRPRPKGTVTFNKDLAPIMLTQCAKCHRPGQSAPFNLLTYVDAQKHAREIVEVTSKRYMPPWLPEPGYGDFAEERRLTDDQIGLIQQWAQEGKIEGAAADLPPPPAWTEGWQLGKPDLIVQMPQPYTLQAEGKDVYRNFVIPIPLTARRFVKAVEFIPGNAKVVHHAFIDMDRTRQSRRLAEKQNPPGFDGMRLPDSAIMPGGQLISWQPGKLPSLGTEGLAWTLEPDTDLVLQLHMHPTGKAEAVQPTVGFFFTDQAPTNTPFRINLSCLKLDIPAGMKDYPVDDSYVLPVDVELLRISPHTHYLGKEFQGFATLPDGTRKWLLLIKNWDFNWQGDYRYAQPVFLPKGTRLSMHFSYDNSEENVHNPHHPPQQVRYGPETTDEMGELWFQVLPRDAKERAILADNFYGKLARVEADYCEYLLKTNPNDAITLTKLGKALRGLGRIGEALEELHKAVHVKPDYDRAHFELGSIYIRQNDLPHAKAEFETVIRLNPEDYQAEGSLGSVYLRQGNLEEAALRFANALRINPDDEIARENLTRVLKAKAMQSRPR